MAASARAAHWLAALHVTMMAGKAAVLERDLPGQARRGRRGSSRRRCRGPRPAAPAWRRRGALRPDGPILPHHRHRHAPTRRNAKPPARAGAFLGPLEPPSTAIRDGRMLAASGAGARLTRRRRQDRDDEDSTYFGAGRARRRARARTSGRRAGRELASGLNSQGSRFASAKTALMPSTTNESAMPSRTRRGNHRR